MLLIFTSKQKYCFNYCMLIISAYIYLGVFEKAASPSGVLVVCWGVSITEIGKTRRDISVSKKEKKRFSCRAVLLNRERLWKSIRRNPRREQRGV